jgi:hypothetical protein
VAAGRIIISPRKPWAWTEAHIFVKINVGRRLGRAVSSEQLGGIPSSVANATNLSLNLLIILAFLTENRKPKTAL